MAEPRTKSLKSLLAAWAVAVDGSRLPQPPPYDGPDVAIRGFVEHSSRVRPGDCFVARVRTGSDGHPYITHALANGAALIVGQRPPAELALDFQGVPYLWVSDSSITEAWLSAAWYGFPSRELVVVGVTGTDGKTTTSNLIYQVLRAANIRSGLLSTIKASIGEAEEPLELHVTTPEAPVVQAYLRQMVEAGLTHCVLETTSHGLAQHRVDAVDFDVAVVTNISHEHLDYHGSYEAYFAAKARLFNSLAQDRLVGSELSPAKAELTRTAILNADDSSFRSLAGLAAPRRLTYGLTEEAEVQATGIVEEPGSTSFTLHLPAEKGFGRPSRDVHASLIGRFNVYNMLAAAATGYALGIDLQAIGQGLEAVTQLSGRMEAIDLGQPFQVIVDFAHTPQALAQAITTVRPLTPGRVIAVFGSAGKRDVAKRRLMAEVSARQADLTVLTAEDPRTESLDEILAMMADGCLALGGVEGQTFWRLTDRGRAIHFALTLAESGDVVLICGKGHEQSMCFGTREYPWDDRKAARAALEAYLSGRPMVDLGLPTY